MSVDAGLGGGYYVLVPSNARFIGCGIESHVASNVLPFGGMDLCNHHKGKIYNIIFYNFNLNSIDLLLKFRQP